MIKLPSPINGTVVLALTVGVFTKVNAFFVD
jgi:hypothetical protein